MSGLYNKVIQMLAGLDDILSDMLGKSEPLSISEASKKHWKYL